VKPVLLRRVNPPAESTFKDNGHHIVGVIFHITSLGQFQAFSPDFPLILADFGLCFSPVQDGPSLTSISFPTVSQKVVAPTFCEVMEYPHQFFLKGGLENRYGEYQNLWMRG